MADAAHRLDRRGPIEVLTFPAFDGLPLDAVVTTRSGGVSTGAYATLNLGLHVGDDPVAVVENRTRAAAAVGLGLDDLVFCRQSHDRNVVVVDTQDRGRGARSEAEAIADTDALLTTDPAVGLVVMVADCVPVMLVCPESGVLACVHAGWRGTVRRVVNATVDAMVDLGARPATIRAALGPAIPAAHYQVGDDVRDAARDGFGAHADALVVPDGTGRWRFDLWAANRLALAEAGLRDRHVAVADVATGDRGAFFSDREARPCGRFAAIARLTG